jgi:hypothetical protein
VVLQYQTIHHIFNNTSLFSTLKPQVNMGFEDLIKDGENAVDGQE